MKGATHDLHRRSRIRRRRRCYDHAPCGHHVHRHHGSCGRRHDGSYGLDDRDSRLFEDDSSTVTGYGLCCSAARQMAHEIASAFLGVPLCSAPPSVGLRCRQVILSRNF